MEDLAEKIKKARKNKGLTLEQLANIVGSSKSYMWQLETDTDIKPSVQLVAKIAEALDVTIDYLINQESERMDLNEEASVFFRGYKELDDTSRKIIQSQIETLKKLQKEKEKA